MQIYSEIHSKDPLPCGSIKTTQEILHLLYSKLDTCLTVMKCGKQNSNKSLCGQIVGVIFEFLQGLWTDIDP